ncbi:MAG: NYN domain-containing protein [Ruminiclostridium sp.]|nr:NYN domain-containing protein [Ruminiclostridium sp.]
MDDLKNIVLLIDADNTPSSKIEDVIREITAHGRIVVKRAYGNWKKEALKKWEAEIKRLAIKAVQQFDYVSGKNATDMALVIDAIHLLNNDMYDAFVIVSSDSDYTPLAVDLHESGVYVIGVGEQNKTPEAFRNSCDEFIFLENIGIDQINQAADETEKEAEKPSTQKSTAKTKEIHNLLRLAAEKYQDDDGFTAVGAAGTFIKRAKPDFDVRTYGFKQLSKFLEAYPKKYEIKRRGKDKNIIVYKCK